MKSRNLLMRKNLKGPSFSNVKMKFKWLNTCLERKRNLWKKQFKRSMEMKFYLIYQSRREYLQTLGWLNRSFIISIYRLDTRFAIVRFAFDLNYLFLFKDRFQKVLRNIILSILKVWTRCLNLPRRMTTTRTMHSSS